MRQKMWIAGVASFATFLSASQPIAAAVPDSPILCIRTIPNICVSGTTTNNLLIWDSDDLYGCYGDARSNTGSFCVSYNRVDGLFLGGRKPREFYRRHGIFQIYGLTGIGLKSDRFQYQIAVERSFFPGDIQFAIGFEAFDLTYSEDEWVISTFENSLAALLLHEDYQDYYRRFGYGGYVSQQFTQYARLKVGYYEEEHQSLKLKTDWALFGGNKKFRLNPSIDDLKLRGIYSQLQLDTRNRWRAPHYGWLISLAGEYFPSELKGDSDFERYILDIRRYQPLSRGEYLNLRIRVGESTGRLPSQKYFDLGGISTLRAFDYKTLTGDRMILGNVEYQINWDRLSWNPDIPLISDFNLILFCDAGYAWLKKDLDFQEIRTQDLYSDAGIGFSNASGSIRLDIAKRLDSSADQVKITFRLSQPF